MAPAIRLLLIGVFLALISAASAQKTLHRPATIAFEDLADHKTYPPLIATIIKDALAIAEKHSALPYKFGGRQPSDGGFDCSGAMYYLLRRHGFQPPRTSAQQFLWLQKETGVNAVGKKVRKLSSAKFKQLRPGDLLFWSGTYTPTDGRTVKITHVGIYIGRAAKDGRPLMVCSSSGRSYRGRRATGFGVYDFRLPSQKSRSTFVGYGALPLIED